MGVGKVWYCACIDFVRAAENSDIQNKIPDWAHGCIGWVGGLVNEEDEIPDLIRDIFSEIGLYVRDITDVARLDELELDDTQLQINIRNHTEKDRPVVWGTIHCYHADGEA